MVDKTKDFCNAWIASDSKAMKSVLKKGFKNKNISTIAEALIQFNAAKDFVKYESYFNSIMLAIETPVKNIDFFAIAIYTASTIANSIGRAADFSRLLELFENLNHAKLRKEFKALFFLTKSTKKINALEPLAQMKLLVKAEKLLPVGSRLWYQVKAHIVLSSVISRLPLNIHKEVNTLKDHPHLKDNFFLPDYILARSYELSGNPHKALALISQMILDVNENHLYGNFYSLCEAHLCWIVGKVEQGDRVLKRRQEIDPTFSETDDYQLKLVERSQAINDPQGMKKHLKSFSLYPRQSTLTLLWAKRLLLSAELMEGSHESARRILEAIDPAMAKIDLFPEWIRLFLLENEIETAAYYFYLLLEKNKNYVFEFIYAHEVSYQIILRLQHYIASDDFSIIKNRFEQKGQLPKKHDHLFSQFIGNSSRILRIKEEIQMMATSEASVLIFGETGTGKEEVAKLLHQLSDRSEEPFLPVNCGGVSSTLIEAELFGYKKGAFTGAAKDHKGLFEAAGNGTIFLDEISSMPLSLQVSLLRVLESKEVRPVGSTKFIPINARVVAATNIELETLIEENKFRLDLYYRLNQLQLNLPALKDRAEDIPLIIQHFLNQYSGDTRVQVDDELMALMTSHHWPGNVRELKNEVERMIIFAGSHRVLTKEMVQFQSAKTEPARLFQNPLSLNKKNIQKKSLMDSVDLEPKSYKGIRKQKLLEFFQEKNTLTRAMVIRHLGCAANTAAKDLKSLVKDGCIKKIIPTSSNRSSYYQYLDTK